MARQPSRAGSKALVVDLNADYVRGIPASATATANTLLALNASLKLPASITGDSDTVDIIHASATSAASKLLALDASQAFNPAGDVFCTGDAAGLRRRLADQYQAGITNHFDSALMAWIWVNDPTGAGGDKAIAQSNVHFQAMNTLVKSIFYESVTNWLGNSAYMYLCGEFNFECGLRIDDGTNNNYNELYLEYESGGKVRVYQRTVVGGGAAVETARVTGLPHGYWGLRWFFNGAAGNWGWYGYLFRENSNAQAFLGGPSALAWTPTRHGLFFTKNDSGPGRGAYVDWWADGIT